jgi:hypothetical protein
MKQIPLTRGHVAIVDDADYELLSHYKWQATSSTARNKIIYARRSAPNSGVFMHRQILQATKDQQVDHINRDGLDNRRANLRIATPSQNQHNCGLPNNNTSGFRGVVWNRHARKWQAQIGMNKRLKYLGVFVNKGEADTAYRKAKSLLKI